MAFAIHRTETKEKPRRYTHQRGSLERSAGNEKPVNLEETKPPAHASKADGESGAGSQRREIPPFQAFEREKTQCPR